MMKTLYKRDTTGKIRTWGMEIDGNKYRTISGIHNGAMVASEWTVAEPKNVGRANESSGEEQARLEVDAEYTRKLKRGYFNSIEEVDNDKPFQPMLAEKYEGWFGKCFSQPKLDGIRCIAKADGLWSRKGEPILSVPFIRDALQHLFDRQPSLVLDGELYNHDLKDDFNKITSLVRKQKPCDEAEGIVQYHVYDIPSHGGGFDERYDELTSLLGGYPVQHVELVETNLCVAEEDVNDAYGRYIQLGYEGQIVRHHAGAYENKRSKNLLKRKEFMSEEFTIVMIQEGIGNWSGVAKVALCELPDGRTFGATLKGNKEYALEVLKQKDGLVGKKATVRFFNYTPDGIPRFPVAIDLNRNDV